MALFLGRLLVQCLPALARPRLIIAQVYNTGARSLIIIMLCGTVRRDGARAAGLRPAAALWLRGSSWGRAAALGLLRELGPVITALLFAGRAGTSLTSEIGLMRATDQLTAMEMMAVDPLRRVVAPRFLGGVIAMPLLDGDFRRHRTVRRAADRRAADGRRCRGLLVADAGLGATCTTSSEGVVKSLVFGIACSLVAVYEGYNAEPTADGVGLATTRTVVTSAVLTLLLDYVLTAIFL